jgi:hypothetical protein
MKSQSWLVIGLCALVLISSGCQPLRKKFTRQKKKDKEVSDFVPVLEPVDYPAKIHGAKEAYEQHYSLFRVWFSDYETASQQAGSERKLIYDLDASLKELDEMGNILKSPTKEDLAKIRAQVQLIRDQFDKPKAFRNEGKMGSQFRDADMAMRKKFKPALLTANFDN